MQIFGSLGAFGLIKTLLPVVISAAPLARHAAAQDALWLAGSAKRPRRIWARRGLHTDR